MNTPSAKLTVLMPVYNEKEEYLRKSIESVLEQTFADFEFLIIDDGSTESKCVEILDEYVQKDPRIRLAKNEKNLGIANSLNKGIALSKTELIARMDSDDYCAPERLDKQYNFMQVHPNCALSGTWAYFVDENDRIIGAKKSYASYQEIKRHIFDYNFFTHPTWIFRKSIVEKSGGYDPKARKNEDYDLLLRLIPKYEVLILPELLCYYRINSQGITWSKNKLQELYSLRSRLKALRKYGYPGWQYLKLLRPLAIYLFVPSSLKSKIIKRLARRNGKYADLKEKNFALFLDLYGTFESWDKIGMLQREIVPYNKLADHFKTIYIFSYGNDKEKKYQKYFKDNVVIIPKKIPVPNALYEFLLPFFNFGIIRKCDIFKTNQNSGSISPTIAKLLHPKAKLVIRSGYIGSEFIKLSNSPFLAKIYFKIAEPLSYFFCDQAFIPTQENYNILAEKYPFLSGKLDTLNNFIDTDLFRKKPVEKKYDIIYGARLNRKQKNHITLLEAIRGLDLKLLLIGQGEEKENIENYCKKNKIDLTLIEKVPNNELPIYYNSAKICAFPSIHEGNPKMLLEAMSCALPIAAFDVPGVRNLLTNEKNSLVSRPDAQNLRQNILRLLEQKELAEKLGESAREFVLQNFALKSIFEKELNIYKKLI